jgi:hypothetical protein
MKNPRSASWRRRGAALGIVALLAAACGSDDGATVRNLDADGETSASASSSASSSSSGSASASATAAGSATTSTEGDGGYEYASNVDSHRLVVLDICGIGDLLDAGDFDAVGTIYRDGVNSVKSDGSVRTIAGFAAGEGKQHGLDAYYGTPTPLDDFVSAALAGSGEFDGMSDAVRGQGVEKGMQNQTMVAWTVHELNAALTKAADGNFDVQEGAVHNWDEGWAFYHGADGNCGPWTTANKRAGNFGTTGDGDIAQANINILQAMIDGRDALLAEDAAGAEAAASEAIRNIVITYSQAAIRYASLVEGDLAEGDAETAKVHQAEGLAFWRVIESTVAPVGADVDAINAILDLGSEPGENGFGDDVRVALEPAWDALGISADEIGTLG